MNRTLLKTVLISSFCLLYLGAAAGPFPPEIAAWNAQEKMRQEQNAAKLLRDLNAAVASGAKEYKMPRDHYRFSPGRAPFLLKDLRDFTLDGNGSTIWTSAFNVAHPAMRLSNCTNVTVKNLSFDNDPLGFLQGEVQEVDPEAKTFTVRLTDGYPTPSVWTEHFNRLRNGKLAFADRSGRLLPNQRMDYPDSIVPGKTPGEYRISTRWSFPFRYKVPLKKGIRFVCAPRSFQHAVSIWESEACRLENITIYASGHMGVTEHYGKGGHRYTRVRVILRPGTDRVLACNADVFHSSHVQNGPIVENCEFSHALDDLLTIHGFFSYVYRQPKADTVILLVEYRPFDFTGSQIRFVDPATGEVSESRLVKSSNVLSEGREAALAEYEKFRSEWKLKKLHPRSFLIELVLDRGIQLAGHRLADTGKFSGRNSIVRNSHLHDGFVRGLLIKAASRIEHNLVERTGAAGILVMPDFYFLENPWPEDVFILRNTFRENNLSINGKRFAAGSGAISILQPQTPGGRGSIRNIRVEENLLESPAAIGILLSGVTGGTICGNRIKAPFTGWESCPIRRDLEKYPYAICLTADRDLKLENNRVEQLPPGISEQNQPAQ